MRSDLQTVADRWAEPSNAHAGLLYERYVPLYYGDRPPPKPEKKLLDIGKVLPDDQERLLRQVSRVPVSPAYRVAWRRWQAALHASGAITEVVETASRLLIGHGNPAPSEVGITLHHVYGVPLLPGTGLKGLLNHYLATWGAAMDAGWEGVRYDEQGRPVGSPGAFHGAIFGVPNLPPEEGNEEVGQAGGVLFEDAWLIPGDDDKPLCPDVLTPHQGEYYRSFGGEPPNDWTDPIPVTFLTVKPKQRFLLAISPLRAERKGAMLAMAHLIDALEQWGVGAKTRAGYGRLRRIVDTHHVSLTENLQALRAAIASVLEPIDPDNAPPIVQRFDENITDALLDALAPEEYPQASELLKGVSEQKKLKKRRKDRLEAIMGKLSQ
jgi:CRISPR-associated protein Cmr6